MAALDPPACPPPDPAPRPPRFAMPAGAVDTHAHLFGPADAYPYALPRGYTPPDASLAEYDHLHRVLGVARGVLTQPSVYGTDNRRILDALRTHGERLRAVVTVDGSVSDRELQSMHALGARGVRLNLVDKGGMPFASLAEVERFAPRLRDLGWHLEFLLRAHEFPELRRTLAALPVATVIAHFGYIPAALGVEHPAFREFLALVRDGGCWVKLSGSYRVTALRATPYDDVLPFARALVAARPERMLWGTDWPHPISPVPMPNDGDLLDQLADWVPDEATRKRILCDNPATLYGFPAPVSPTP